MSSLAHKPHKRTVVKAQDIQRCALQIVVGNIPYEEACYMLNFPSLAERRLSMCKTLF